MDRRKFLLLSLAAGGSLSVGRGFLAPAFAAPAQPGASPYGPLLDPDANGLRLPEGFTSRVIKQAGRPIGPTAEVAMPFPDGAATFPTDDGGWILVSNSETPPPGDLADPTPIGLDATGGVQAIVFAPDGTITDAYSILTGSRSNCAGGATPWGTWLSCEEVDDGQDASNSGKVFECDPTGATPAVDLPLLGRFKHENAAVDPLGRSIYLTEDLDDGLFYRFTPAAYPLLTAGVLEAAKVDGAGHVSWLPIADPGCTGGTPCRQQAEGATTFAGGEGCVHDGGKIFLTTKGDDRVWMFDITAQTIVVLYDAADFTEPVLTGVDHVIAQAGTGNLVVAEDGNGSDFQAVMIRRDDFAVFPIVQMTGPQHGQPAPPPFDGISSTSEVSGLAFNPAGDRLYLNSQRGFGLGITYEVTGPWLETVTTPKPTAATTTTALSTLTGGSGETLPDTGGSALSPLLVGGTAGAAGLLALRRRLDRQIPD